ncbi:ribosome-binding protein 1-like isoform X3 [Physella acuta]|uniref:ribosome-binding protein 1-like isoform X3 n=1 Tax=Physella acuta TaxID=109671 RepID=UPI0027DE9F55|nr:ribosome-binding protein 1-like isoform X3 [Physella acuta]
MELITILIGIAAFIISALLIYCISAVSMREKTFEEVMEEQRRRQEEEREKAKAEKKAEREQQKKKYKKGKEKVKEKAAQVNEPESKVEQKMVNLEIEPEIIEPTESLGLNAGVRQRGKKEKSVKPILHNKGEVTPVVEKTVEVHHKSIVPKDELELKKSHEKIVIEKIEKVKAVHTETSVKEIISRQEVKEKENLPPKKVEKIEEKSKIQIEDPEKRSSKQKANIEEAQVNGSKLISSVKSAKLSDSEVQTLIDILLNRQGLTPSPAVSESWNKKSQKGDPLSLLKKQLEEKEKALQEEQLQTASANSRLRDLKNEITSEKTKFSALEKKFQEVISKNKAEVDALQQRMKHSQEQHVVETSNLQTRIRQLEQSGDKSSSQKVLEENKVLQDALTQKSKETVSLGEKIKSMEKELNNSQNKIQSNEAVKKTLESKISTYEDKIRKLESAQKDTDSVINKRVDEISLELKRTEAKNSSLISDLQKANSALTTAQSECSVLKTKLQELEAHLTKADANKEVETRLQESEHKRYDLEGNVKNLEKQLDDLSKRLSESDSEIKRLQQENKALSDENKLARESLQNAPASNGDIHENGPSVSQQSEEHERILTDKNKEISDLLSNLESQKKLASSLQTQLDNKNAEVTDLQGQLNQQRTKNNELREKNWKAMEALEKAEKSSAEKVDKAMKSARELSSTAVTEAENFDKAAFQRLFPDVQISDKLSHKDWVVAFEKLAVKKLQQNSTAETRLKELEVTNSKTLLQLQEYEKQIADVNVKNDTLKKLETEILQLKSSQSSTSADESGKISALQIENNKLLTDVEHYRNIVSETENKLHQLEKSIDAEEKKWQEKLKQALSGAQKDAASSKKEKELETLVSQQKSQIEEYRQILSRTANSLTELEKNVASEEKVWQGKLTAAQSELTQTKDQLSGLKQQLGTQGSQEDLTDLSFAYHCVEKSLDSIVDEMQVRVEKLETELREAQEKIIVITREKETVITQLKESHVSGTDTEGLEKQLSELRTQLEAERKKNKGLSLDVVKLNGIIKTGQDALAQEQGLVKQLRESLDSKSVSSGVTEAEEIEQLRVKLSEKQKLLEREMATNKQLSERLAATTNNDSGTSV